MKSARKRIERAVAAVMSAPTDEAAAEMLGVSLSTFRRLTETAEFKVAYATAVRQVRDGVVRRVVRSTVRAVDALDRNLDAERPADQIRAAEVLLRWDAQATQLRELADQVEYLRSLVEDGGSGGDAGSIEPGRGGPAEAVGGPADDADDAGDAGRDPA